ncbi:hypothetical protein [uncultured Sphingomonas sp.]|uniref:hypothetical protein n=1 Tax=uncultured Sphingomonas sp. TaxID=158754 RepID=UPI0025E3C41F|nr:hypothetical protein [uncultured Sphingomonas sp.]
MAHDRSCQHRIVQARSNVPDQLERLSDRFDVLTHRARLGEMTPKLFDELEADAQAIAGDLVAIFRGRKARPTNPPLHVSADGLKAKW